MLATTRGFYLPGFEVPLALAALGAIAVAMRRRDE
ncbi:MAG: PGF-CTERM sorting domain-containing protein [Methanobacteriota archaeon]